MSVAPKKKFWSCGEKRQGIKIVYIVNVTLRNADCLIHASGNSSKQQQIGEILELCEVLGVKVSAEFGPGFCSRQILCIGHIARSSGGDVLMLWSNLPLGEDQVASSLI